MPQLRIVMVSPYPVKLGMVVGGIEAVASTLAPAIAALDAVEHVTVLCFHHGEVPVHNVVINDKLEVRYLRGQDRLGVITRSILEVRQTRRIVAKLQPHIVHGQEIGWRGDVATQSSPNSVVTVHGLVHRETALAVGTNVIDKLRVGLVENMVKRVLARAKVTISISGYDAAAIGSLVRGHHVHIPNPINPLFLTQPVMPTTEQRVLFAGVHVPRKNIEGLLDAFALALKQAPDAQLVLVGPRQKKQVVYDFLEKLRRNPAELCIHGDGSQVRDFLYVTDAARAALWIAERGLLNGEAYNIGAGMAYSIAELAAMVCTTVGVQPRFVYSGCNRPGDPEKLTVNINRLKTIGYDPQTTLANGLRHTIEWYNATTSKQK